MKLSIQTVRPTKPETESLGSCCNCACEDETVRNIILLEWRSPEPGDGCWGCFVCDLPMAGAIAVLCENCMAQSATSDSPPQRACLGYPAENRRIPFSKLTERFQHDESKHPESEPPWAQQVN